MNRSMCLAALACAIVFSAAPTTPAAEESVSLTVYNGGYGVVREVRTVDVRDGRVKFQGVASGIDPTTVFFRSLTDPGAKLLEQNYQYDLVSPDKLLDKHIDEEIEVLCEGAAYTGTLLAFDSGQLVLRTRSGVTLIRRDEHVKNIVFKSLPASLLTRPTLLWHVATDSPGEQSVEVAYQTTGLNWHAEYVLVVGANDASADLSGWVSVENRSGKRYEDAKLKFIAGDVQRVRPQPKYLARGDVAYAEAAAPPAPMEQKAFFEYHMYTLPRPSTVANNEVKQLEMFPPARGLDIHKRFLYQPLGGFRWHGGVRTNQGYGLTSEKKVSVYLEFDNSEDNRLGIPLPAGKVRVYKRDPADEALEFIGEEAIDHTPKDEELSLRLGNAFDLVGERKQVQYHINTSAHRIRETIEIKLRNHKDEAATIRVREPMYRAMNWHISDESHSRTDEASDARSVAWDIPVEADGETVLTYTVEYSW
jgi:hypothetical protein